MNNASFLVSAKGGTLHALSPSGEVLFSIAVPPGKQSAREYLDLLPGEAVFKVEGLTVVNPRVLNSAPVHADRFETGANPDFTPTSATATEMQMRQIISGMQAMNDNLAKKMAALDKIETMPQAPKAEEPPVVE